jgi:hypothetical protein
LKPGRSFPAVPRTFWPLAAWETLREGWRLPGNPAMTLEPIRAVRRLSSDDVPLVVVTRNEMALLTSFVAHYRRLGVTRFLVVDDRSTDGTAEFLAGQPDVDLYRSNIRYGEADRGKLWRQAFVDRYGHDRWYVLVDADEFLVTSPPLTVREIAARLRRHGISHLPAPMLDLYPPGPVHEAGVSAGTDPASVASHYDASGYDLVANSRGWRLLGGPRRRIFKQHLELMKYPLMYWSRFSGLKRTIHAPTPYWRNLAPISGALLHFKFMSGFEERFAEAVSNAQHWNSAGHYSEMLIRLKSIEQFEMADAGVSVRYEGPADLVQRGFMAALPE